MGQLQTIERESAVRRSIVYPSTKTVAGFEGTRIITGLSGGVCTAVLTNSLLVSTLASTSVVCVYYAGIDEYDAEFVSTVLAADRAEPEATFDNVVDMLGWLNR